MGECIRVNRMATQAAGALDGRRQIFRDAAMYVHSNTLEQALPKSGISCLPRGSFGWKADVEANSLDEINSPS